MAKRVPKAVLRIKGASWCIGADGDVSQAVCVVIDVANGEGRAGRRDPPSNAEDIDSLPGMKAAFGNMLSALWWLEEIIRKPGWRKHDPELCAVGAVAGWLLLAQRIIEQHLDGLRRIKLRLGGSVRLEDRMTGSSFCERAVSETRTRLQGMQVMFQPTADVLRSPKEAQAMFYSKSLREIDGDIKWDYPKIQCDGLYQLVAMELDELGTVQTTPVVPVADPPLFGMTIDHNTRTVKRFVAVNAGVASCVIINNDDQWALFLLFAKSYGTVDAKSVRTLLPDKIGRDNEKSRLVQQLNEIQLTIEHEAKTGYVLREFQG